MKNNIYPLYGSVYTQVSLRHCLRMSAGLLRWALRLTVGCCLVAGSWLPWELVFIHTLHSLSVRPNPILFLFSLSPPTTIRKTRQVPSSIIPDGQSASTVGLVHILYITTLKSRCSPCTNASVFRARFLVPGGSDCLRLITFSSRQRLPRNPSLTRRTAYTTTMFVSKPRKVTLTLFCYLALLLAVTSVAQADSLNQPAARDHAALNRMLRKRTPDLFSGLGGTNGAAGDPPTFDNGSGGSSSSSGTSSASASSATSASSASQSESASAASSASSAASSSSSVSRSDC